MKWLRVFLKSISLIFVVSWAGCFGATAINTNPFLDSQTSKLVHDAHDLADHIHGHHFIDDEASSLEDHCEAHDRYDELAARFDAAVARGDLFAARAIGDALADLGEEIGYDEYLADEDFGGYDWCFCLVVDDIIGPHTAFVEIQSGFSNLKTVVEDFNGNKNYGILGVGLGMTFPITQQGVYGYVKSTFYDMSGSSGSLFSPISGYSAKIMQTITGDVGLGFPIVKNVGVHASVGLALADVRVDGPGGNDTKWAPGYTFDGGIDYKLGPRWSITLDARFTSVNNTNVNPSPGVNFGISEKQFSTMLGLRYTIGSTTGYKTP